MNFAELTVKVNAAFAEILIVELGELGFDSFLEDDAGFAAYIDEDRYDEAAVANLIERYQPQTTIHYQKASIARVNWNEEWEKNYEPILVEGQALIRSTFHTPRPEIPLEVIITPKMSFGTGHHATTYLVTKHLLQLSLEGKRVLDAGCGTGILAIVAAKQGASHVEAYDIDTWCVENSTENFSLNELNHLQVQEGTIETVSLQGPYDVVVANINKNVLLGEMKHYVQQLSKGGSLFLSGFYTPDIPDLLDVAQALGLVETHRDERNDWAFLSLRYDNGSSQNS